ncbi:MAG: hypothetical protein R3F14_25880 [Polyangiaceae bacterium]
MRHGGWIDAVGGRCQSAGFADVATKSEFGVTNYAFWGGNGRHGDLRVPQAPVRSWHEGALPHDPSGKVINHVRLHCR